MYDYQPLSVAPRQKEELPPIYEDLLTRVRLSLTGKQASPPIAELLKLADAQITENTINRINTNTNLIEFIQSTTQSAEVINARGGFDLLHQYLDHIEGQLSLYESIFNVTPPENLDDYTSVTLNIVERG